MMKSSIRIGWILREKKLPSSRIHGENVHRQLRSTGYNSNIIFFPSRKTIEIPRYGIHSRDKELLHDGPAARPAKKTNVVDRVFPLAIEELDSFDVVIIQKYRKQNTRRFIEDVKKHTKAKIVYIDCDFPIFEEVGVLVDLVVTPSSYLCDLYRRTTTVNVVHIPDAPEVLVDRVMPRRCGKKALWFGFGTGRKWKELEYLRELFSDHESELDGWSLSSLSNRKDADFVWDDNAFDLIKSFDAVMVPNRNEDERAFSKSSARVVQAMALGVPVLASPLPAYLEVVVDGVNGYICRESGDWVRKLRELEDVEHATRMAAAGLETSRHYSMSATAATWAHHIEQVTTAGRD